MTPPRFRPSRIAVAISLVALFPSPRLAVAAEPPDDAASARVAELNESGAKLYADRSYRRAIEKFIEAYAIDHDPNLLFNIARCYEELGETDAAIEKYQEFVAAPGADTGGRARAQESMKALEKLRSEGPPPRAAASGDDTPPPAAAPDPTAETGGSGSVLPWVTLGAGVLAAGAGTTFYVLGVRDHGRVTSAPGYGDAGSVHPMTEREARSLVSAGDTKKLVGGVGLGLGGALIATSAVLFLSGKQESPRNGDAALSFTVDPRPRSAALVVSGRF